VWVGMGEVKAKGKDAFPCVPGIKSSETACCSAPGKKSTPWKTRLGTTGGPPATGSVTWARWAWPRVQGLHRHPPQLTGHATACNTWILFQVRQVMLPGLIKAVIRVAGACQRCHPSCRRGCRVVGAVIGDHENVTQEARKGSQVLARVPVRWWWLLQVRAVAVAALPPLERQVPLVEVPAEDAPSLRFRWVSTVADTDRAAQVSGRVSSTRC
jgi:hypothetical protein